MIYRQYIKYGYPVFPLWPIVNGECGCANPNCCAVGKHPYSGSWQFTPLWSDEQIANMELAGNFKTGYGVLIKNLLVVDIDERNDGFSSYIKLLEKIPELDNCSFRVQTGSGGASMHLYYKIPENTALVQKLYGYEGIDFKSSGYVVGAGSLHKSGNTYKIMNGSPAEITIIPKPLLEMLKKPDCHRAEIEGSLIDISDESISEMLSYIDPDCDHDTWIKSGMAIHNTTNGAGFSIWNKWSSNGTKYPGHDSLNRRWHSFGKSSNPVTLGTLKHYAEQAGWIEPVTFTDDTLWSFPEINNTVPAAITSKDIDLLRPPGFVGKLTEWINSRCRFPRQNLAVAAALSVVSNAGGMRYVDSLDGVTPNLFLFGVAASATGKESILKSAQELLRSAGVAPAVHGGIKSEQEIYRNLVRHQAAIYYIDEIGEVFSKLQNARTKGTTAYLEGVVGTLLSIYSKANSYALITGDMKEEVRYSLQKEHSALIKTYGEMTDNDVVKARISQISNQLSSLDMGLEHPYLSIFGLTTPERFDTLMDYDMAVNGFMGRSLIFREYEDNPRSRIRDEVIRSSVPDSIAATLQSIYAPGYSELPSRVGRMGKPKELATRPDAIALLNDISVYFEDMAEEHQDTSGMTAIPRRGYEQVSKISMVLAIPEGLRTVEHVQWAFALVKRDVEEKIRLALSNSTQNKNESLKNKIISLIGTDGITLGKLSNRIRNFRKEDVESAANKLVECGFLVKSVNTKGKSSIRYHIRKGGEKILTNGSQNSANFTSDKIYYVKFIL